MSDGRAAAEELATEKHGKTRKKQKQRHGKKKKDRDTSLNNINVS